MYSVVLKCKKKNMSSLCCCVLCNDVSVVIFARIADPLDLSRRKADGQRELQ
jgi:hypothetical protein